MKHAFVALFIVLLMITIWFVGDHFCAWDASDDEICESSGLECGIVVTVADRCGERRVVCGCGSDAICDNNTFTCNHGMK